MRFIVFAFLLMLAPAALANERCDWQIMDVVQDQMRGSVVVKTEYKIDGYVVYNGETRYDEQSGSDRHIVGMIRKDVEDQCSFLLKTPKIPNEFYNRPDLIQKKKKTKDIVKSLTRLRFKKGTVSK